MQGLYTQNLVPIYLLEEKLRANFQFIQNSINKTDASLAEISHNLKGHIQIYTENAINVSNSLKSMAPTIEKKVEAKVTQSINLLISKKVKQYFDQLAAASPAADSGRIEKELDEKLSRKIKELRGQLKLEVVNDTQTIVNSQFNDIRKQVNAKLAGLSAANNNINNNGNSNNISGSSGQGTIDKDLIFQIRNNIQLVDQLVKKVDRVYDSTQRLERTGYDYYIENGDKIKLLSQEFEAYKQLSNQKFEKLVSDFSKFKSAGLASGMSATLPSRPSSGLNSESEKDADNAMEQGSVARGEVQHFKGEIINWVGELEKSIQDMLTKTEFTMLHASPVNKRIQQLEYESSTQKKELNSLLDLFKFTNQLNEGLDGFEVKLNQGFENLNNKIQANKKQAEELVSKTIKKIQEVESKREELAKRVTATESTIEDHTENLKQIDDLRSEINKAVIRIAELERLNNYQQHMPQIHELLDKPFVKDSILGGDPGTIAGRKGKTLPVSVQVLQLGQHIKRIDNEHNEFVGSLATKLEHNFLLYTKKTELNDLWKAINILESRLQAIKFQQEQSNLRKQIVSLSIEKGPEARATHHNQKFVPYRHQENGSNNNSSNKKLDPVKQGGFGQKANSSKIIKPFIPEDKPEKVERIIRQRYLSDTVKLPDILQEKLLMQTSRDNNK